jgi:hypothetical protein
MGLPKSLVFLFQEMDILGYAWYGGTTIMNWKLIHVPSWK